MKKMRKLPFGFLWLIAFLALGGCSPRAVPPSPTPLPSPATAQSPLSSPEYATPTSTGSPEPPTTIPSPSHSPRKTVRPTVEPVFISTVDPNLRSVLCQAVSVPTPGKYQVVAPILLYHHVGGSGLAYNVSAEDFRDQLDLLLWLGYTSVNVHQIAATMLGKGTLPDRPVAITFDDDWEDQYLFAYPLLADRGMTATFYVPSTYPGGIDFMTWDQLRELSAANYEIGSHSRTHPHLAGLDYSELWPEIRISKVEIQRELRMKVWTFSYPYGEIPNPPSQLELIGQAGYEAAVIGNPDVLQSELYLLNRIEVLGGSSLSEFASLLPWRAEGREYCAAR